VSTQETELDVSHNSNENIQVKVTKQPNCQIKFEITVTPQAVSASYIKAVKNVNKEVNIPGFRKGKAPDRLILERYGSHIQKEWIDLVLQVAFNEAIQLTHIHPLKDGNIKRPVVHECSQEKGANFTIEFESRPIVPSVNPSDLTLKKIEPSPITQQQEENALEQVLNQLTDYQPIEDRSIQEGDFINLDVDILEETPRRIVDNQRVRVNSKDLPAWILEKVIGLKKGETAKGETDAHSPEKQIPFLVTIQGVWEGKIPEINDDLAKKTGLQSVEDLHKKIRERLKQENELEAYQKQIKELNQLLTDKYPIDLPRSLIDSDKKARLSHYLNQLQQEHHEDYFAANQDRIEEMIEKTSVRNLQLFFLLHKIATDYHIEVSDSDLTQELNHQLALIPSGRSSIDIYDKENLRKQVYTLALDRKIKQFLLDKATLIEG
jgi:trigger factor